MVGAAEVTIEEIKEQLRKLRTDPREFFKLLSVFDNVKKKIVPFILTETQEKYLDMLMTSNRIVIVKARQIGISTVTRAYFLWRAWAASEPLKHAVISYTRDSANHLHGIDKAFLASLPPQLGRKMAKDSAGTLRWEDTDAELKAFTAGGKAGATRSFSFTSCHISEFAFFDDQAELLSNCIASAGEGQIIIETTVKEAADHYSEIVAGAAAGTNGWTLAFFPWHGEKKHSSTPKFGNGAVPKPTEDELALKSKLKLNLSQLYWRHQQVSTMGEAKFRREFPSTVEEAFRSGTKHWLSPEAVAELRKVDLGRGPEFCYEDPDDDERYAMGVDVANGTGGDSSAITVVSTTTGQPVFHWADNRTPPFRFAEVVKEVYHNWNEPLVLVEGNGVGQVVLGLLEQWEVDLWKDDAGKNWQTGKTSKAQILERLREMIERHELRELEGTLVDQLCSLVPNAWGGAAAPKKQHDDLVMSFALALEAREAVPRFVDEGRRVGMIDRWKTKVRAQRIRLAKLPFRPASFGDAGKSNNYKRRS